MTKTFGRLHVLVLLCLAMSFSFSVRAQAKRDVVYLKNGSIIKGNIVEMIPNGALKIETADGSILIFKMEEVERTEKETLLEKRDESRGRRKDVAEKRPAEIFLPRGYFIMAKVGPSIKPLGDNIDFSIAVINGIQMNEYLSLGLGAEYLPFRDGSTFAGGNDNGASTGMALLPVFLDTRFYIPKQRIHAMFSFQFGCANAVSIATTKLPTNGSIDFVPDAGVGGLYMGLSAGMRIFVNDKFSIVFDGGPSFHSLKGQSNVSSVSAGTYEIKTVTTLKVNVGVAVSFGGGKKSL